MSVQGPPRLYFEPPKLLNFDSNADPDPTFRSNADPDPASKNNADAYESEPATLQRQQVLQVGDGEKYY